MEALRELIHNYTGLSLGPDKDYLVEARLAPLVREYNLDSLDNLAQSLSAGGINGMRSKFIDALTTHETFFFRDMSLFKLLGQVIFPELLKDESKVVRILSAACSTGQEIYSLRMLLDDQFPKDADRVHITAVDVSEPAVEKAKAGFYSAFEISRGLSGRFLEKYFTVKPDGFQINECLQTGIQFEIKNILSDDLGSGYDLVFCRNVAMYFEIEDRTHLYKRLKKIMPRGARLFVGGTENVLDYYDGFTLEKSETGSYYRA